MPASLIAALAALPSPALIGVLAALPPAPPVSGATPGAPAGMVLIPAGSYLPLYRPPRPDTAAADAPWVPRRVSVKAFYMDVHPVTNGQFLDFVRAHPEWWRSRVERLFADPAYLRHWKGDLDPGGPAMANRPVVNVSWFAARAYCAARGKRLPSVDQWEYAAAASAGKRDASRDSAFQSFLRAWYARPTPARLPPVRSTFENAYGVWDLHGLVWEWTLDFNSALVSGESRGDAALERSLYCGSGAANAADFENYPAFMRYAFRSSLEASYCIANLGFRGVMPVEAGR